MNIVVHPFVSGLNAVTVITPAPQDRDNCMYICEQTGTIYKASKTGATNVMVFGDIQPKMNELIVDVRYDERGLLGMAFHPDYFNRNSSGYKTLFLYYSKRLFTVDADHLSVLSSFVCNGDPININSTIDMDSERVIFSIKQQMPNHNSGNLMVLNDYLYFSIGDGGGGKDVLNLAQNPNTPFGKLMRVNLNGQQKFEIYATGFCNPWGISYDDKTKNMFLCDIGGIQRQEVNIVVENSNYGWSVMEGTKLIKQPVPGTIYTNPIYEYTHKNGQARIVGGYFLPNKNKYIFADYDGTIMMIENQAGYWKKVYEKKVNGMDSIRCFGMDSYKNLYVAVTINNVQMIVLLQYN